MLELVLKYLPFIIPTVCIVLILVCERDRGS